MIKYAGVLNNKIINITDCYITYPPTQDGEEVQCIELDYEVEIGMELIDGIYSFKYNDIPNDSNSFESKIEISISELAQMISDLQADLIIAGVI